MKHPNDVNSNRIVLVILLGALVVLMCSCSSRQTMRRCDPNGECPGTYTHMNGGW